MNELILFGSTFASVFALGFQSQNVNNGHYIAAFLTSFLIGSSQIVLYKLVPGADMSQVMATLAGGPLGITASMFVHRKFMKAPVKRNQGVLSK